MTDVLSTQARRASRSGHADARHVLPERRPASGGSIGSVVPKLLAVLVAMVVVRNVIGAKRHHGGSSRWGRRREAVAQFHRELHAEDSAAQSGESTGGGEGAATKA
jgi:hypothetical protein